MELVAAEKIRLGIIPWAGWTPALAGERAGIWTDEGVDVEVTVYSDNVACMQALLNGDADIITDMIGTFVGQARLGNDIRILGETDWSHGGDKAIIRKGVTKDDLRTATIGIYLDQPSVHFFLYKSLKHFGLDVSRLNIESIDSPAELADRFINRQYPLIVNFDPDVLRALREGDGKVIASSATFPGVIPEGFGILAETRRQYDDKTLGAFLRGWLRCVQWAENPKNWPAYMELLRQEIVFGPRSSEADLLTMCGSVSVHLPQKAMQRNLAGGGLSAYLTELDTFLEKTDPHEEKWSSQLILDNALMLRAAHSLAEE